MGNECKSTKKTGNLDKTDQILGENITEMTSEKKIEVTKYEKK